MLKHTIIFVSLIIFLFMGLSRFLGIGEGGLESASSRIAYPFLVVQRMLVAPLNRWREKRQSSLALMKDLERSLVARENLQQEVIQLKALLNYTENSQDLRDFLNRYENSTAQIVRILLKNFSGSHYFLIDAGAGQGIEKDMIALHKDTLIGRVIEVYPYYSKVLLLTDQGCKIAAFCAGTNTQAIHEGMNRLDMTRLSYVNHLDEVKEGDLVLSSGEGLIFPRGFGLGRIKQQEHDGLHYSITVQPLTDLNRIDYCAIVKQGIVLNPDEAIDQASIVE